MENRFCQTDLTPSPTSYSEAPAEGICSVIEKNFQSRESLSIENLNALARIRFEGPGVATMQGYQLSKDALVLWNSHQGECFITKAWEPGLKNKAMLTIHGNTTQVKDDDEC